MNRVRRSKNAGTYWIANGLGGAGAKIQGCTPQTDRAVKQPAELDKVLQNLEVIHKECNSVQLSRKKNTLAVLIVMGGCAAAEGSLVVMEGLDLV